MALSNVVLSGERDQSCLLMAVCMLFVVIGKYLLLQYTY